MFFAFSIIDSEIYIDMNTNIHTHTYRCRHAVGEDREYVISAIKNGIKILGFSDHAPFVFPDGYESGFRIPSNMTNDYTNSVISLKREFRSDIKIHLGFEMEYYPSHFKNMLEGVNRLGAEYLILGQHFINNEHPLGTPTSRSTDDPILLQNYVNGLSEGMASGVYTYVAHPDMIKFQGSDDIYLENMRKICVASKKYGIPLEINFLGLRDNRNYPNEKFWKLAGEEHVKVVFGTDAHSPDVFDDRTALKRAYDIVEKYSLDLQNEIELVNPSK